MEHPLTQYREQTRLSVAALAERVGASRQTIHRIEKRKQTPSLAMVERIIRASGDKLTANDFLPPQQVAS